MRNYLLTETRRVLRDRQYLLFAIGFPVLIYTFFSQVGVTRGQIAGTDGTAYSMVSMAAFGAISSTVFLGSRIAAERRIGWNRHLRITPLRARTYVVVKVLSGLITAVPSAVLVLAAGAAVAGVRLPVLSWPGIVLAFALGVLPFAALGVAIGYATSGDAAQPVAAASYMTLSMLGGLWFPAELMPSWMARTAHILPTYHLADLGWRILAGRPQRVADVLILAAWGAAFVAAAVLLYRRDTERMN